MSQKTYLKILQWGIYVSFLGFFLVFNNWLYPYSTPKQLYFNILVELLAVVWLALVIKYPEARPKKSWLTWSLAAWLFILLVSSVVGVDWQLSFWGDANRMLGWFHLVHFFVFYLIIITVFKTKADWRRLFGLSLITSSLMVLYSLLKAAPTVTHEHNTNLENNISTLGNATYVAGVMLVCFYFALLGFLEKKQLYQKILYILAGILVLVGFGYADVSGSQAGLVVGLLLFGLLYTFLAASGKTKKISLISLGAVVAVIALIFAFRWQPIFNNQFGKLFRDFSFQNVNFDTRLYAWRAGLKGWQERPVLGWGYGNFSVVNDKFFEGSYYRYSMTEEYFDRAHNNLIDLAVTSGMVGLLIYLAIFVAATLYLIKGYRQGKLDWLELAIPLAIIIAYLIHNLAVFDSWANYFLLFMVLAWVFVLYQGQEVLSVQPVKRVVSAFNNQEIIAWLAAGAVALFLIFNYNVAFGKMFNRTINLTAILASGNEQQIMTYYQEPFKLNTPMDRSGINAVSDYLSGDPSMLKNLTSEEKRQVFDYLISLNKKVTTYNPDNSLEQLRLGRMQMSACLALSEKQYCQASLEPIAKSMALGGQHLPAYLIKEVVQVYMGDVDGGIATLEKGLTFYKDYTDMHCRLAQLYLEFKNTNDANRQIGRDHLRQCVAEGGESLLQGGGAAVEQEVKSVKQQIKTEESNKQVAIQVASYDQALNDALKYKGQGDAGNHDAYYKAIDSLNQAIQVSNGKVWIPYLNLGNIYKSLGDYSNAEVNYNKALDISGGDNIIYLAKIELYQLYEKRPATEVKALYQEAIKKVVENVNLMINYAAFCRDNGYTADALNAYKSLLKSFPNNGIYQQEIDKLQAQLKQ